MLMSSKCWTDWHRTDFFTHRVRIGVIVRAQANTVIPVLTAEARYINERGASESRLFGPQVGGLRFSFWQNEKSCRQPIGQGEYCQHLTYQVTKTALDCPNKSGNDITGY